MRLLHLADTHFGKKVSGMSMKNEQEYVLEQIYKIIKEKQIDRVLISGDVYDKSIPAVDAVEILNGFLDKLAAMKVEAYIISGNHDGAARLEFAAELIDVAGIHIASKFNKEIKVYKDKDEYGEINFYLLPFIKPIDVKHFYAEDERYGDEDFSSYDKAIKVVMENTDVDTTQRNVILSHQFVVGANVGGSEDAPVVVGGVDQIGKDNYKDFDYVALGHIHRAQNIEDNIRYPGTLLKYSFSEVNQKKTALIVDIKEKGNITYENVEIKPMHDMSEVENSYDQLTLKSYYESLDKGFDREDYLRIILTDEKDIPNALMILKEIYPNLLELGYKRNGSVSISNLELTANGELKTPLEMIEELFEKQMSKKMDENQREFIQSLVEEMDM